MIKVLVGQVIEQLGEPDGVIAFDPSSFPKRGTHSVGVKRRWCSHRGKVDNCQVGVFMGYVSRHDHALLDFRLSLPEEWARDEVTVQVVKTGITPLLSPSDRVQAAETVPLHPAGRLHTRR